MRVSGRLAAISLSFFLPIAVMVWLIVSGINDDIKFATWEKYGNNYQRPLEKLMEALPEHESLALRVHAGDVSAHPALIEKQGQIDQALTDLDLAQSKWGAALLFTAPELSKRKRDSASPAAIRNLWNDLKNPPAGFTANASRERHAKLVANIRTMISHLGETSNLILDPDLDSYDLTDITVTALPQNQDRLAAVTASAAALLARGSISLADRIELAQQIALLKDAEAARAIGDGQGALEADENYYGISPSLQKNLPPAISEYSRASETFTALLTQIATEEKTSVKPAAVLAAGAVARKANFKYWETAVNELDTLIQIRIHHYIGVRKQRLILSGIAVSISILIAFFMARSINRPLRKLVGTLNVAAGEISIAAAELSSGSQTLAEGAREQAASLEETGASLEEVSSMTRRNAENAQGVKEFAKNTRQTASEGAANVAAMGHAVMAIRAASSQMSEAMNGITEASSNVSKIIRTIDEIAFQTNILALNAAIEAARAGAAGHGFAVVAEEVRSLAKRSATAARETSTLIETSIARSGEGLQITTRVAESIEHVAAKSRLVEDSFSQILRQAEKVDEQVAEIAVACNEQSQGISHVSAAISQIENVTQRTAAGAEETANSVEELNVQVDRIKSSVLDLVNLVSGELDQPTPTQKARTQESARGKSPELEFTARARKNQPFTSEVLS